MDILQSVGFDVLDVGKQILLAIRPLQATGLQGRNALILVGLFSATLFTGPYRIDNHFHEDGGLMIFDNFSKPRTAPVSSASSRTPWQHSCKRKRA